MLLRRPAGPKVESTVIDFPSAATVKRPTPVSAPFILIDRSKVRGPVTFKAAVMPGPTLAAGPVIGASLPSGVTTAVPSSGSQCTLTRAPSAAVSSSQLSPCRLFVCHVPISPGPPDIRVKVIVCRDLVGTKKSVVIVRFWPSADRV